MHVRHQRGYLRCVRRTTGIQCWEFLWRETDQSGRRMRRTSIVGTVAEYPTKDLADAAVNGLRMKINNDCNRLTSAKLHFGDLIDHYLITELSEESHWRSHATRIVYREFLNRWIRPYWGAIDLREVRTVAVEEWLRQLHRNDGLPLANSTKAKIRNLMSVLFNHAIRYEWLDQGKNPIKYVRQSALRKSTPAVLEPHEIQNLLAQLKWPFRVMVLVDVTTGMRRSELFALKWSDIDFSNLTIDIKRSVYQGVIGNCKTEASRRPVPLSLDVAADLWLWKETSAYSQPDNWVFTTARAKGSHPRWPDIVLTRVIRPDCRSCGDQEKDWMAHLQTHLLNAAYRER